LDGGTSGSALQFRETANYLNMAKRQQRSRVQRTSVGDLIASSPDLTAIFNRIKSAAYDLDSVVTRTTKSQIAFRRRRGFAWVWVPVQYLHGHKIAPIVLSVALSRRDRSSRWKEVVEPRPGRFMHHLELITPSDVDSTVKSWLKEAWSAAA
jgi:hypothetical protein